MDLLPGQHWYSSSRSDDRALALYKRHYSAKRRLSWSTPQFVGPGEDMVLLTVACDALFVWLHNTVPRLDGQVGVNCAVFRNEGPYRASDLILEAEQLAWQRWPGARLFTYVSPKEVHSEVKGYCFRRARWRRCGESKSGLLLFEKWPAKGGS